MRIAMNTRNVMRNNVGIIHRSLRAMNLIIVPHLRASRCVGIARAGPAAADPAHTMSFLGLCPQMLSRGRRRARR